jgi:hypothetical protein
MKTLARLIASNTLSRYYDILAYSSLSSSSNHFCASLYLVSRLVLRTRRSRQDHRSLRNFLSIPSDAIRLLKSCVYVCIIHQRGTYAGGSKSAVAGLVVRANQNVHSSTGRNTKKILLIRQATRGMSAPTTASSRKWFAVARIVSSIAVGHSTA